MSRRWGDQCVVFGIKDIQHESSFIDSHVNDGPTFCILGLLWSCPKENVIIGYQFFVLINKSLHITF